MDRSFREKPSSVGKEPQTQRSGSKENSVGSRHVVVYANNHMCRNVSFLCQLHRIKKFLIKKNWPSENETLYLWHLQTLKAKECVELGQKPRARFQGPLNGEPTANQHQTCHTVANRPSLFITLL